MFVFSGCFLKIMFIYKVNIILHLNLILSPHINLSSDSLLSSILRCTPVLYKYTFNTTLPVYVSSVTSLDCFLR